MHDTKNQTFRRWTPTMRSLGLLALLCLLPLVGGCGGDSSSTPGATPRTRLTFGIGGDDQYQSLQVILPATAVGLTPLSKGGAGAATGITETVEANCDLVQALKNKGCSINAILPGRGKVDVTIFGCNFNAAPELFSCLFEGDPDSGDLGNLAKLSTRTGVCSTADTCDPNPSLKISGLIVETTTTNTVPETTSTTTSSTTSSTETTITTSTTSTSVTTSTTTTTETIPSTTTTSTSLSTTTTTLGDGCNSEVTFTLNDTREFGSLQMNVDFSGADPSVSVCECRNLMAGAVFVPNPDNDARTITIGGFDTNPFDPGLTGVAAVAACTVKGNPVVADDFVVEVVNATDPTGTEYTPEGVDIGVSLTTDTTTTTSSSSTSTTEAPPTTHTSTTTLSTSTTLPTTTTSLPPSCDNPAEEVVFILNDTREFGSLQMEVDFSSADPALEICACRSIIAGAVFIPNPDNDNDLITIGGFDTNPFDPGFKGVNDLAACSFAGAAVIADDFVVTVLDGTDPTGTNYDTMSIDIGVAIRDAP